MRTVPYVRWEAGSLAPARGHTRAPGPGRRSVRRAVESLAADGAPTFSRADIVRRVGELGGCSARVTLHDLIKAEARRPDGVLTRVRADVYRPRGAANAAGGGATSASAALAALRSLAEEGRATVTLAEVRAALAASGVPYSARSVAHGLLQLTRAIPPLVVRPAYNTYRLA